MYGAYTPSRHNLAKLDLIYHVDKKYGVKCESKIGLIAKHDMHFWKYLVGAEPEGDGQEFLSDISFSADETSGKASAFLPLKDNPHGKEIVIFFLPYIKQGEKCEMNVVWSWPRCMGQLRDKGEEEYCWTCDSVDGDCVGELRMEYLFDKKLGDIQCRNVGISPPGAQLQRSERPSEIVWTLSVPQAPLGKGNAYRLIFERR
jgi:hypothetical protein